MHSETPEILDHLSALADTTRGRLLLVLERQELTVSELMAVLQAPQSTVSRHLKVLVDGGWLTVRARGSSRLYSLDLSGLEAPTRRLWNVVKAELATLAVVTEDARRLASVLRERAAQSQAFFESSAGAWDRVRREQFGHQAELAPLLGLLDERWVVGDLGCGTGHATAALAPFVRRVVAVDGSPAMLDAARARLQGLPNVEVRQGELESLPLEDSTLDAAVLLLVLHHVGEPGRALAEVARVLAPGGKLLVVDMAPHDRQEYRREMGHVWLGFEADQLSRWLDDAGFVGFASQILPPDPAAQGPGLFAASARLPRLTEATVPDTIDSETTSKTPNLTKEEPQI